MLKFSIAKNNALAEVIRDVGNIFFASLIIGPFITKDLSFWFIIPGFMFTGLAWYLGIRIVKE